MAEVGMVSKAIWISENLYKYCIAPDNGKRVRETGSISPATCLKNQRARDAFGWAGSVQQCKRFFTEAAVRLGISKLLEKTDVKIPIVGGLSTELWLQQQTKLVLHLCKRARKNIAAQYRFPAYRQSSIMDWQDTLPMEARYTRDGSDEYLKYEDNLLSSFLFGGCKRVKQTPH